MIPHEQRLIILQWVHEAVLAGAQRENACAVLGLTIRSLQRWVDVPSDTSAVCRADGRPSRVQRPANRLSDAERTALLAAANEPQFGALPPSQIIPILTDAGRYLGSESTLYRLLRQARQLTRRRPERCAHPRSKPRALTATAPTRPPEPRKTQEGSSVTVNRGDK